MSLTRTQLIADIAERTGKDKKDVEAVLGARVDSIADQIKKGEAVTVSGFVKFSVRETPEGERKNPFTGDMVWKPASKKPKVTILKGLKDAIA